MLQRDYVLEIVGQFVESVSRALRRAAAGEKDVRIVHKRCRGVRRSLLWRKGVICFLASVGREDSASDA